MSVCFRSGFQVRRVAHGTIRRSQEVTVSRARRRGEHWWTPLSASSPKDPSLFRSATYGGDWRLWLAPAQAHNWCGEWSRLVPFTLGAVEVRDAHAPFVLAAIIRYSTTPLVIVPMCLAAGADFTWPCYLSGMHARSSVC